VPRGSLSVEAVWDDPDVIEVRVAVSNSEFSGVTLLYVSSDDLSLAAHRIRGFPTNPQDERRVSWGSEESGSRLGKAELLFRCVDAAGHAVLAAELLSSDMGLGPAGQCVKLEFPVEPASIDVFAEALLAVQREKQGGAVLEGAA